MGSSTIGIKIADGSFYPILDKDSRGWKRLVLTTVRDGQTSVQIDLYEDENVDSERYVGSLLIEDITPAPAGESEIELQVGIEEDGKLSARAEDLGSGESQSLNVSLESLTADSVYDVPEFELGEEFDSWTEEAEEEDELQDELSDEGTGDFAEEDEAEYGEPFDGGYSEEEAQEYQQTRRRPFLLALFIVIGIAAIAALAIFLFELFQGPEVPPLEARGENPVEVTDSEIPGQQAQESPAGTGAAAESAGSQGAEKPEAGPETQARDGPAGTEVSGVSPSTPEESIGGVWYWIRWGDTLWDISSSFYRNPWRYDTIAEKNSIRNPDLIFAGAKIYIPEKE